MSIFRNDSETCASLATSLQNFAASSRSGVAAISELATVRAKRFLGKRFATRRNWKIHCPCDRLQPHFGNLVRFLKRDSVSASALRQIDKKTARGLATRGRWDFCETLLGFFEGGLGGCEACHGDAER